ncbi:MAG: tRNA (adenosine(37)-N6)-threonylcarbamoyltransferase complex dimerization subunit type 1 TsaB [Bacteroidetes bacterium]|nr:MAG: tRNA (adenosine(37)-N6)-threonylcarbamoyltransferase complex dimerization subunit type 1 TsaB [Bacteroidota bacterium]
MILCLETSTKACSVALGKNGTVLALKESVDEQYSHAENLTLYIEDVCKQSNTRLQDIDAVAVSKGPGSFTGLRIGVSVAKGLCYALDKPLIAINSLEGMTVGAIQKRVAALRLSPNPSPQGEGNSPVYHTAEMNIWQGLKQRSREMRKNPTPAEELLWEKLRANKTGYKIRRQHAIDKFICDFVCLEKQLAIELDGEIHQFQQEADRHREEIIGDKRFSVLRFSNDEILNDINSVVAEIKKILDLESLPPLRTTELEAKVGSEAREGGGAILLCPMIDARRMEVYCAVYDEQLNEIKKTSADIINENSFSDLLQEHKIIFFGDGAAKCKSIISHPNTIFTDDINPSAQFMIPLAEKLFSEKKFEDVAYFEPFYLKDFFSPESAH